jgi:hypothetical protein
MPGPVVPLTTPSPTSPDTQPGRVSGGGGTLDDRISKLETWIDFLHNYTAYPITNEPGFTLSSPSNTILGGITVPWYMLRPLLQLPDDRWDAWASGWLVNPSGSAVVSIYYQRDDTSTVVMLPTTFGPSATYRKVAIGPAPVRGAMAAAKGAPQGESILSIGVMGNINAGTATFARWTLWIRQSPRRS